ncbi:MAG: hypothetical protein CMJ19_00165 [Phycisphaeraceae bacterium]|nr:hypothetical protein [Phycisphaeraceae bacterium]
MHRLVASVVICLLGVSSLDAQPMTEEFDSPSDLAQRWQAQAPKDATAKVEGGKLVLAHNYDMRFRPGVKMQSISPVNLSANRVVFLMQVGPYDHGKATKKDLFNAYKFSLGDKVATLSINRSVNKEVVRFFIDGKKVWDSYPFDRDRLFPVGSYIGFAIDGKDWKVLCTDDPSDHKLMRAADKSNSSQGTLAEPANLVGQHLLHIDQSNIHGPQATWSIERLLVQP